MCEEETALARKDHDIKYGLRVFKVAFKIKRTELRNVELEVISKHAPEVWVNSAFLQVFDCAWLVGVHPDHCLRHVCLVLAGDV